MRKAIQLRLLNDEGPQLISLDYLRCLLIEMEEAQKLPAKEKSEWLLKKRAAMIDEIDDALADFDTREVKKPKPPVIFKSIFAGLNEHENEQALFDKMNECIERLHWYDKEILRLYILTGNYREVSRETGIPHQSIWNTVKAAKKKLKEELS